MAFPKILKVKAMSMQICCPAGWNDTMILKWAEKQNPAGFGSVWKINPVRGRCPENKSYVHIILGT